MSGILHSGPLSPCVGEGAGEGDLFLFSSPLVSFCLTDLRLAAIICKNSLLARRRSPVIRKNARKTVVRVSSKGQVTMPAAIRKSAGIEQGDFLKAYTIGDKLILLEKTSVSPFEEIVERFSRLAGDRSLSEKELQRLIKDVRRELTQKVYGG